MASEELKQRLETLEQQKRRLLGEIIKSTPDFLSQTKTPYSDVVYLLTQSPTFNDVSKEVLAGRIPVKDLTPAGLVALAIKVS